MQTRESTPIYASPLLWGVVLLATGATIALGGLWTGLAVFGGAVLGIALLALLVILRERYEREPQYDNKLDPWDD